MRAVLKKYLFGKAIPEGIQIALSIYG